MIDEGKRWDPADVGPAVRPGLRRWEMMRWEHAPECLLRRGRDADAEGLIALIEAAPSPEVLV